MNKRATFIGLTIAVFTTSITVITSQGSAAADRPSTGLEILDPIRVFDSRGSSPIPDGAERQLPEGSGSIINVWLTDGEQESWLYFHPCGSAPDRTTPAAAYAPGGAGLANTVPVRSGESCMTRYGDADVIVDRVAREGVSGGLNYVAHDEPTELDATLEGTTFRTHATDGNVPPGADGLALWVTIISSEQGPSAVGAHACGSPAPSYALVAAGLGKVAGNLALVRPDNMGDVCFTWYGVVPPEAVLVSRYGYLSDSQPATAQGLPYSGFTTQQMPGFTAQTPERLFDTRLIGPPVAGGTEFRYQFTDLPDDATAVAINITATQTTGPGFVSAYPCGSEIPEVSNVNFTAAGQTVPNFAIVSVGLDHELCFYARTQTHLLVDLSGYFSFGGGDGYLPLEPQRLFDTRVPPTFSAPRLPALQPYEFNLGLLRPGATAAVMNVTAVLPTGHGYVTVYPCDVDPPTASNLNFAPGQVRANLVTVRIPADGRICFISNVALHLIADIAGVYHPDSEIGLFDETPWRLLDTREFGDPLPADEVIPFDTIDDGYTRAVAWNLTATQPVANGFVRMFPCDQDPPVVSNLNFFTSETVANFSIVAVAADGSICGSSLVDTHLIIDEAGLFVEPIPWEVWYE